MMIRTLCTLLLLAAPLAAQFSSAKSIWGRPIDSAAPTDAFAITWSAAQGKFIFAAVAGSGTVGSASNPQLAQYVGASSTTVGGVTVSGDASVANGGALTLATKYKIFSCQPGLGDGLNAIAAGTYLQTECMNEFAATYTITAIKCYSDNNGTSTLNVTNGAGTALLTGAITCTNSIPGASGTQGATTTIVSLDGAKFTFVADGTTKQTTWVLTGTR